MKCVVLIRLVYSETYEDDAVNNFPSWLSSAKYLKGDIVHLET